VPCGLIGERVASLRTLLGPNGPDVMTVRDAMTRHFEAVCGRALEVHRTKDGLPDALATVDGA
jgi:hypothetical protein